MDSFQHAQTLLESIYELLDFGEGRKLERLGEVLLERPSPAAERFAIRKPELWKSVDAKFVPERKGTERGHWVFFRENLSPETVWLVSFPPISLEMKCSPFGHLGVFPEQQINWRRIAELVSRAAKREKPPAILNLFAYTGGSTLAAASAGAQVVHIDSAKNLLARARRNAEVSGLSEAPIRWIAEDAVRFVQREIKRNRKYDGIILDPPSYGHGTRGNVWQIDRDLPELVENCFDLLDEKPLFLLLTCHTPFFEEKNLATLVRRKGFATTPFTMEITASTGAKLPAGNGVVAIFDDLE